VEYTVWIRIRDRDWGMMNPVVVPEAKKLTIHEAPKYEETRMAELLSPKES
jgi:hypothetical protein